MRITKILILSVISISAFLFGQDEVDEIWITFPDPQLKKKREEKRLTHPSFLIKYSNILSSDGLIHLKTDSQFLYGYTTGILSSKEYEIIDSTHDIDSSNQLRDDLDIQTHYEIMFRSENVPITYLKFKINNIE